MNVRDDPRYSLNAEGIWSGIRRNETVSRHWSATPSIQLTTLAHWSLSSDHPEAIHVRPPDTFTGSEPLAGTPLGEDIQWASREHTLISALLETFLRF